MVEYPPYVDAYGKIADVFQKIIEAQVPPKYTNDFIYTKLGLKSTSYRASTALLKRLGFVDNANIPTEAYREYRDPQKSKLIMARQIMKGYKDLFSANEYAYKLKREEVISKLNTLLGTPTDDKNTPKVAGTFLALCALADFEGEMPSTEEASETPVQEEFIGKSITKLGLSYTINLNLPATTDIEVFNAIFKALKENLLK
jgi:hypothetical protein